MRKKVYISYSHKNKITKKYVEKLAYKLDEYEEIEVIFDKYHLRPGYEKNKFRENSIEESDKILVICDESYKEEANFRENTIGIETQLISSKVYQTAIQTKIIPVYIENEMNAPIYLKNRQGVLIKNYDLSEEKIDEIMISIVDMEVKDKTKKKSFMKKINKQILNENENNYELDLYIHFLEIFKKMCYLESWSNIISPFVACGPYNSFAIINSFGDFILYRAKFNFIENEKFSKFNIEIKIFADELSKLLDTFLKHVNIDYSNQCYSANRFYRKDGQWNENYDLDLQKYNEWEEEIEKIVHSLTLKLNILSKTIRKTIDSKFMLYEGKFSYYIGPFKRGEYYQ
ncbi:toll/interleukin-1 receptor domain-containing protein [Cetobacterium somerae]|uniref:toll/interleukin-1 receptor domain-containing protein n=1 Tax=Cetobacterium somerae TaxID=188913 RepID=UPI002252D57C|nr:toll/interleukin-1 receptor domain-containing protein [Cetobacterium somerae]